MHIVKINNKVLGGRNPILIVAELSSNHMRSFDVAKKSIIAIKESGADAIKIQTYTPDTMTIESNNDIFKISRGTPWDGKTYYELYKETYMPWEWQPKLKKVAEDLGLLFFSTPFDISAVDFLEKIKIPCYKISSFEITDIPLIEYVASKKKPVIISTGIATLEDIEESIATCKKMNNDNIILLKCTSFYPAPLQELNLGTIVDMKKRFDCLVGLSDHTLGLSIPVAATALGAVLIEKHFTLDKEFKGPDSKFSLNPREFKKMVEGIRQVEKSMGVVTYDLTEKMKSSRIVSRSLFVIKDIKKGKVFTEKNIKSIRPGHGLHPRYYKEVLGRRAKKYIKRGTPLSFALIDER